MASEIRVNKIENRSGLGTVTFADTGVDLAGIVTATTFSGSGASLTSLPAASLTGTVADARFPATLPAISAANLTNVPAANITGTLPALTAANLTNIPAANLVGVCTSGLTKTGGFGKILQVVHVDKTDHFTTTSTSFTDVTGLSASITPTSASSDIIVTFKVQSGGGNNLYGAAKCQRDIGGGGYSDLVKGDAVGQHRRVNISMDTEVSYGQYKGYNNSFTIKDTTHNTTSEITYKLVCLVSAGTLYINRYSHDGTNSNSGTSSVTLMEVSA